MDLSAVPVLMYHSVKYKRRQEWIHPHITLLLKDFNRHLKFFRLFRVNTFFLDELYDHITGKSKLPLNSIVLTFDDGYLDNFVFVFPLLKKYKLKATIWVNPDFVDNNDTRIRPTLEDYWNNKISLEELNKVDGFLNWEEMRLMEKSGLVDIQSHTMTHTKYPVSDKIVDFISPDTKIDWLYWNLFPEDKTNFLTNPKHKIPFGYPIYETERANVAIRYEEDGELTNELINYVNDNGGAQFFISTNWKDELFSFANKIKTRKNIPYKKETDKEYLGRIRCELSESKKIIEQNLQKEVNHVCWPFGGRNELTYKLAEEAGYLTSTGSTEKNIFRKKITSRINRIALDNPKYQNSLFRLYAFYKIFGYKF